MKLFISVLFVIFSFSDSKAQGYISMIDTTLEWTGCFNYVKDGVKTNSPIKYRFINKDTVFKTDTFKILMAYTEIDTFIMGGLREDTTERKAYGFYDRDTAAYLMYDFSFKNPNNTLWINPSEPVDSNYLVIIASFLDIMGVEHKVVELCCGYSYFNTNTYNMRYVQWFEGIGSETGVIHNNVINKLPQYRWPNTPQRELHFLGINKVRKGLTTIGTFSCSYNDTSLISIKKVTGENDQVNTSFISENLIRIKLYSGISKIEFFSLDGKKQFDCNEVNASEFYLSTSGLPKGWYLLEVISEDGIVHRKKLIL